MRYFLQFSYFGKPFHGWQKQPNAVTVQQVLEEALSTLLRNPVELVGAGRTDSGVHARQMFAHFDCDLGSEGIRDTDKINVPRSTDDANNIEGTHIGHNLDQLVYRLNAFLPEAIAVQNVFEASEGAHARFDATERTYEYIILQEKNPFYFDFVHYIKHPLSIKRMNEAADILLHHQNFECFSKSKTEVRTYRCDIKRAIWEKKADQLVFTITADRFLRNMVRAIVGTLLEVGLGKLKIADVKRIINSRDRSEAGPSVPAKGLYLTSVRYPSTTFKNHG